MPALPLSLPSLCSSRVRALVCDRDSQAIGLYNHIVDRIAQPLTNVAHEQVSKSVRDANTTSEMATRYTRPTEQHLPTPSALQVQRKRLKAEVRSVCGFFWYSGLKELVKEALQKLQQEWDGVPMGE